jgi:hypothetical protein
MWHEDAPNLSFNHGFHITLQQSTCCQAAQDLAVRQRLRRSTPQHATAQHSTAQHSTSQQL